MEDLYEILQEHVITQLGDIITQKKSREQKISIPKVKLADFQDYITNLKNVFCLKNLFVYNFENRYIISIRSIMPGE